MSLEKDTKQIVEELLSKTPFIFEEVTTELISEESEMWCRIVSLNGFGELIGKNGETLLAITHIVKKILKKKFLGTEFEDVHLILDVNNYQKDRIQALHEQAHMLAEQARYFKSSVEAAPMSSFERRVLHDHLSGEVDILTESAGVGFDRRVIISYKK